MKNKEELIQLLEKVISIADSNIENENFDFEDFGYVIERFKDELKEVE